MFQITIKNRKLTISNIYENSKDMVTYCLNELKLSSNQIMKLIEKGKLKNIYLNFI